MKILNLPALAVFAAALVVGCAAREQPADRATEATMKDNEALPGSSAAPRSHCSCASPPTSRISLTRLSCSRKPR